MKKFKVGDKVRKIDGEAFCVGTYTATITGDFDSLLFSHEVRYWLSHGTHIRADQIELVEPDLDQDLKIEELRFEELRKQQSEVQLEMNKVQKRINKLKAEIKERDKPKGKVPSGVKIPNEAWIIRANGLITKHERCANSGLIRDHGNMFYDKESARYEAQQRKQAFLQECKDA